MYKSKNSPFDHRQIVKVCHFVEGVPHHGPEACALLKTQNAFKLGKASEGCAMGGGGQATVARLALAILIG